MLQYKQDSCSTNRRSASSAAAHCPLDSTPSPMVDSAPAKDVVIWGVTAAGRALRPSDWAERLAGLTSAFGFEHKLAYSPLVRPMTIGGVKAVVIGATLAELEPRLYQFLLQFRARQRARRHAGSRCARERTLARGSAAASRGAAGRTARAGVMRCRKPSRAAQTKRAPAGALVVRWRTLEALRQHLDRLRKPRLGARRKVLVHDLLVGDAVDHRLRRGELRGGCSLVAGRNRLSHFLDRAAQLGLEARVVLARLLRLAGGLARLGVFGQGVFYCFSEGCGVGAGLLDLA